MTLSIFAKALAMGRKTKHTRILAIDTSLSSPGFAVIDVDPKGRVQLVEATHVKTDPSDTYVQRGEHIEAFTLLFARKYRPFDAVVRESFASKFQRTNYPIFTAWAYVDKALRSLDLAVTEPSISPSTVKKTMTGKGGKVTKEAVADGVRRYVGEVTFDKDDASDAAGIALTWAIKDGVITKKEAE